MSKKKGVHAVPHAGKWAVKKEGAKRASSVHDTQEKAWRATKKVAKSDKTEAYLHRTDGTIRERETYGRDPHPPKG